MKNFETIWKELLKEFPEIKSHSTEIKPLLKDFIAKKPTIKISKQFKEELEEKIKFEIEILKKNESLIKKQINKTNWIKIFGFAFSGFVIGFMVQPLFTNPNTSQNLPSSVALKSTEPTNLKRNQEIQSAPSFKTTKVQPENSESNFQTKDEYADEESIVLNLHSQIEKNNKNTINFDLTPVQGVSGEEVSIKVPVSSNDVYEFLAVGPVNTNGMTVNLPFIKNEENGGVGCGTEIVWTQTKGIQTKSIANESFRRLFKIRPETEWLRNTVFNSRLNFSSVNLNNGLAKIYLTGNFGIGHCAIPEIKAQIEETAFQFDSVQKIEVYINDKIFDWCELDVTEDEVSKCDTIPRPWIEHRK